MDHGLEENYRKIVEEACENGENRTIRCQSAKHSKHVSRLLIENAEEDIRIYQGIPEETFYQDEEIANAFEEANERGVKTGILLQGSACPEFENFCEERNILLRDNVRPDENVSHWTLADNNSYRVEKPHDPEDFREEKYPLALVNFNDEDRGNRIKRDHLKLLYNE